MVSVRVPAVCIGLIEIHPFPHYLSVFEVCLLWKLARTIAIYLVYMKYSQVTFYRSLPHSMLLVFSGGILPIFDLSARFVDWILCFFNCCKRNSSFGRIDNIYGMGLLLLFWLYPISLQCHSRYMSKTYMKCGAAYKNEIALISLPSILTQPPCRYWMPSSSTNGNTYQRNSLMNIAELTTWKYVTFQSGCANSFVAHGDCPLH